MYYNNEKNTGTTFYIKQLAKGESKFNSQQLVFVDKLFRIHLDLFLNVMHLTCKNCSNFYEQWQAILIGCFRYCFKGICDHRTAADRNNYFMLEISG